MLEEERQPPRGRLVKLAQEGRRAQKLDRYTQIVELHQQGLRAADIASRAGIGEPTVYRWKSLGSFPEARRRHRRPSLMDPNARCVLSWWQEGNRNGSQLYQDLTSRGDIGSPKAMSNDLATLRTPQVRSSTSSLSKPQERKSIPPPPAPLENFSAQRATWLFVCQPEKLDQRQRGELALIRQASPHAESAYCLAQAFMQMIREQTGEQVDTWLSSVEASHLPALESFAKGIQHDKAAVQAGVTLPWSTGPVEGHVNRRQHQ